MTEMALRHPEINYVGIRAVYQRALRALQKREKADEIPNLYYLCIDACELPEIFALGEVGRIYLNFSEPWPKDRLQNAVCHPENFSDVTIRYWRKTGSVEFKTDNRGLFEFALEEAKESGWSLEACTFDLHHEKEMMQGNVMTEYEEKFSGMGNPIHKMIIRHPGRDI